MNPDRDLLRLLILGQLFLIVFLALMPLVIRWLPALSGKDLYLLLVAGVVTIGIFLRRAVISLDGPGIS